MLKRLWLVLSLLWATFFFLGEVAANIAARKPALESVNPGMVFFSFAPLIAGVVVWPLGRYVLTGSFESARHES